MPPTKADRDAALALFYAAGLVPVLSTNGRIPDADVEVALAPRVAGAPVALLSVTVTEAGQARLEAVK